MNLYGITITKKTDQGIAHYTKFKFAYNSKQLRAGVLKKMEGTNWRLKNIYFIRAADSFETYHTKRKHKNY